MTGRINYVLKISGLAHRLNALEGFLNQNKYKTEYADNNDYEAFSENKLNPQWYKMSLDGDKTMSIEEFLEEINKKSNE